MATNAIHGRFGGLYVDQSAAANATATLLPNLSDWSVNESRDQVEVTVLGETTKTYTSGLKDYQTTFNGILNSGSTAINVVADGVARRFYHYVDISSLAAMAPISGSGKGYWYGYGLFSGLTTSGGVADAVKWTINGSAATDVYRV